MSSVVLQRFRFRNSTVSRAYTSMSSVTLERSVFCGSLFALTVHVRSGVLVSSVGWIPTGRKKTARRAIDPGRRFHILTRRKRCLIHGKRGVRLSETLREPSYRIFLVLFDLPRLPFLPTRLTLNSASLFETRGGRSALDRCHCTASFPLGFLCVCFLFSPLELLT